jgi:hypothetical protein
VAGPDLQPVGTSRELLQRRVQRARGLLHRAFHLRGSLGYRGQVDVPWEVVGTFTLVAIVGIIVGTRIVRSVSHLALRRAFAYFLFVMAAFILVQNRAVLANPAAALRPSSTGTR